MKSFLYRFFYTALTLSLSILVFAVNKGHKLDRLFTWIGLDFASNLFKSFSPIISYTIYILVLLLLALLMARISTCLTYINIPSSSVKLIEPAGEGLMLTYLGLFFFALSVHSTQAMLIIYVLLLICVHISNVYLFNPIFSFIGYKFYYLTFEGGKRCLLISKEKFAHNDTINFEKLYKLNEFTYID